MRPIFGSLRGGGGLAADDEAASVTKHLDRLASGAMLEVESSGFRTRTFFCLNTVLTVR